MLPCGHRCPSLCGEACPPSTRCPQCQDIDTWQDVTHMGEIPVWLRCCGAKMQLMTLDDEFAFGMYYEEAADRRGYSHRLARTIVNRFSGPKPFPYGIQPKIPKCAECGQPIRHVNRYRRIVAFSTLVAAVEQTLPVHNGCMAKLEQGLEQLMRLEAKTPPSGAQSPDERKSAEVYGPEDPPRVTHLSPPEDALDGILDSFRGVDNRRIHAFRMALRAVRVTYGVTEASLQRSLQASYAEFAKPPGASLGLPRFDLTLELQATFLYLRLCLELARNVDRLQVQQLASLCIATSAVMTRMRNIVEELHRYDSTAAVAQAGIHLDMAQHITSYHALVVCCASHTCMRFSRDEQLTTTIGELEVTNLRRTLVDALKDSTVLLNAIEPDVAREDNLALTKSLLTVLGWVETTPTAEVDAVRGALVGEL